VTLTARAWSALVHLRCAVDDAIERLEEWVDLDGHKQTLPQMRRLYHDALDGIDERDRRVRELEGRLEEAVAERAWKPWPPEDMTRRRLLVQDRDGDTWCVTVDRSSEADAAPSGWVFVAYRELGPAYVPAEGQP